MVIHPYPTHLVTHWQLPDGSEVTIRPIRPEDAEIEIAFVHNLSPQSRYFRFLGTLHELTPEILARFTQVDYDKNMALIATTEINCKEMEIGVARYVANPDRKSCEFAIVVDDKWHKKGIGSKLLDKLLRIAKMNGFKIIEGEVLMSNSGMIDLLRAFDFTITTDKDDIGVYHVRKAL